METVELDVYVLDVLMRDLVGHDRCAAAFLVYLDLWRAAMGEEGLKTRRSLRRIALGTGLSRRGIQNALLHLRKRRLITVRRRTITDVPEYRVHRPWLREVG